MTGPTAEEPFEQPFEKPLGQFLVVDLDGYEGPLDVLLTLAREQKVDLKRISILQLAEQYLAFIVELRKIRLEIAADYLVMAAWLAYLKSRLLLPEPEGEAEPSGEELAARLSFQLQRLEAMRLASQALMARDRVGQNLFVRGMPEGVRVIRKSVYEASLLDLLKAYAGFKGSRGSAEVLPMRMARTRVVTMEEALERLTLLIGQVPDWTMLSTFLPPELRDAFSIKSATASTFTASLEMAKQGMLELRQMQTFGPIYIRRRTEARDETPSADTGTEEA